MAEEKIDIRDVNFRRVLPWTELFRGFQVALDPRKLLLAAAGILAMSAGWVLLSVIFYSARHKPELSDFQLADYMKKDVPEVEAQRRLEADYKADRAKWELLHRAAGPGGDLRTWPWYEDRGPNPYLMVTGQAAYRTSAGELRPTPWERGAFWDWLFTREVPVLIEPLIKFLKPVIYFLHPNTGFWNDLYFFLVLAWTLATWGLFGGAITRMAAVQLARKEKISMNEAVRFAANRYVSFFSAPLFPLLFVVGILVLLVVFGVLHMIPVLGDVVVDGLGWPLVLMAGLVMAVILVGLIGWPMMYATISTEGSDSFDALSRSYSYVYQCPWHYLWNGLVGIAYGILVVFFVGFMASLTVYLGKWGVAQTPFVQRADRDPSFLFVHAPESFGWRELLLQGSPAVNDAGVMTPESQAAYYSTFSWYNKLGAGLVAVWLYLAFLMVLGFGYSYFWSASTIIYLLMRRQVDDTDLDEVYLEEDEAEDTYATSVSSAPAPAPTPAPAGSGTPLQMVDAPALKTPAPPPAAPLTPPAPAPAPAATNSTTAATPAIKTDSVSATTGDGNTPEP